MINRIFEHLGTPNDEKWPGYSQLPHVQTMQMPQHQAVPDLREKYNIPVEVLDD